MWTQLGALAICFVLALPSIGLATHVDEIQAKIDLLKSLHEERVISDQEYQTKLKALQQQLESAKAEAAKPAPSQQETMEDLGKGMPGIDSPIKEAPPTGAVFEGTWSVQLVWNDQYTEQLGGTDEWRLEYANGEWHLWSRHTVPEKEQKKRGRSTYMQEEDIQNVRYNDRQMRFNVIFTQREEVGYVEVTMDVYLERKNERTLEGKVAANVFISNPEQGHQRINRRGDLELVKIRGEEAPHSGRLPEVEKSR